MPIVIPMQATVITRPGGWPLWALPGRALGVVLGVELAAGLAVLAAAVGGPAGTGRDRAVAAVLLAGAVLAQEGSLQVERRRERRCDSPYRDLNNTWTFAAALLVPPVWAAAVVVGIHAAVWLRVRRYPLYRWCASVACMTLGVLAATWTYGLVGPGLAAIAAAAVPMLVLSPVLLATAIRLALPGTSWRHALGTGPDLGAELATCCLGVFVALAAGHGLGLPLLAVPVLSLLSWTLLVSQLQRAAATDRKTGLLDSDGWRAAAGRRTGPLGLLVIDLDHFKAVNDTYGHLAGDAVLRAVARVLETEPGALAGRWGGEEFVVLVPAAGAADVAERLRARIAALRIPHQDAAIGVTASIGVAVGTALDALLPAADAALYTAKTAGRNRTAVARPTPPPAVAAGPAATYRRAEIPGAA